MNHMGMGNIRMGTWVPSRQAAWTRTECHVWADPAKQTLRTQYRSADKLVMANASESQWGGPMRLFFTLQIADVLTTLIFRSLGQAESNPLVGYLMDHFG